MERERQRELDAFVHEHVRACATRLLDHLLRNPAALEGTGYAQEHLLALSSRFDPEHPDELLEVFEHWIVDRWLAEELEKRGESVGELFGLRIWGRATTGQAIKMDEVIRAIFDAANGRVRT